MTLTICQNRTSAWQAAALFLLLFPAATLFGQQQNQVKHVTEPIQIGQTFKLDSAILGDTREINVWTPPSYKSSQRSYPTLYIVDGGLDQDFHHISGLAQLATINGSFEELIVIGIRTNNRYEELIHEVADPEFAKLEDYQGRVAKSQQFLDHIRSEVIPLIESKYRVNKRRAIVGESLAGLFIAEVFLMSPDSFSDYICVSPSLWWDNMRMTKEAVEKKQLASRTGKKSRIYLTIANEGGMMKEAIMKLKSMLEERSKQTPSMLEFHFVNREKTHEHSTIYHPAVHDALLKLFSVTKK